MAASKPSFSVSAAAFSAPPVTPMTRQPKAFLAIWPTSAPTAPLAAVTTIVSPAMGRSTSTSPPYAVAPGMPKAPTPLASPASSHAPSSFQTGCAASPSAEMVCTVVSGPRSPSSVPSG